MIGLFMALVGAVLYCISVARVQEFRIKMRDQCEVLLTRVTRLEHLYGRISDDMVMTNFYSIMEQIIEANHDLGNDLEKFVQELNIDGGYDGG